MSDSLQPHESQHTRPPCPSQTPGIYSNLCPSSRWCHPTILSSVVPFSSCPQSLPASGSFPMSQLFAWGGPSIGVSASASVLPMNTQDWSPLGWTGWISLQSKGLSRVFSNTIVQKHQFLGWGINVTPWLIHVNVWKNPLQCCEVISLQLTKINGGKKKTRTKASILQHSAFFTVQLSHPYMTTGKTIALTRRTFIGNVSAF